MVKTKRTLYLDKKLVKEAKKLCIDKEISLSKLVEDLLKEKLRKKR